MRKIHLQMAGKYALLSRREGLFFFTFLFFCNVKSIHECEYLQ